MKTFGVLLGGWLVGGAVIVALVTLGAGWPVPVRAEPGIPPQAQRTSGEQGQRAVLVPVAGVEANELRDTFEQARGGGRIHHAMDILAPRGTPVVAAVDGTIRKLFSSKAGGLTIYQFDRDEERVYYYAHLDGYAAGLAEGQWVRQGTVLGYVGTSGNAPPDTPHLHFSIEVLSPTKEWWKGQPVNPYPLLAAGGAVPGPGLAR